MLHRGAREALRHERRDGTRILVSGSSSKILSGELASLLTGRHMDIEVLPPDLAEYARFRGVDVARDAEAASALASEFISSTAFPQAIGILEPDLRRRAVHGILTDILHHDIASRYGVSSVEKLEAVAALTLASVPGPLRIRRTRGNLRNPVSLGLSRPATGSRELEGLGEVMSSLGLSRGVLVTMNERSTLKVPSGEVEVLPFKKRALEFWSRLATDNASATGS
ncbi:MAG: AAA family ATPase [Thermoplasmata archaeon]